MTNFVSKIYILVLFVIAFPSLTNAESASEIRAWIQNFNVNGYRTVSESMFSKADSNGAKIVEDLIKKGILERVTYKEVRLKQNEGKFISRPQEIVGSNFDAIWSILQQSLYEKEGNLYYIGSDKNVKQLTFSGRDREPRLHPKGKWVYFVHSYEGKWVGDKYYPPKGKNPPKENNSRVRVLKEELWRIYNDGTGAVKLYRCESGFDAPDPDYDVAYIENIQFSPNGDKIYFETPEFATESGLRVMDANGSHQKLLGAGTNTKIVLSSEIKNDNNRDYSGYIITAQHHYFEFGGSYDWYYLFTPDFKEVGPVGEDRKSLPGDAGIIFTDRLVE